MGTTSWRPYQTFFEGKPSARHRDRGDAAVLRTVGPSTRRSTTTGETRWLRRGSPLIEGSWRGDDRSRAGTARVTSMRAELSWRLTRSRTSSATRS